MFESAVFDDLRSGIRGQVIEPGHPEYESARRVYNGMIDRRPRAVIRCAVVSDVVACVKLARRTDSLLAIRGGGHNGAGFGTCSDGMDEGEYRVEKTYRGNHQRLVAVKRTFDPSNHFRINQNVDPSRA